MADYQKIANDSRKKVLELIHSAQVSHVGSNMSCIDLLVVLFEKAELDTDEVVLSKGWAAASWYYFLWRKGVISEEELNSFCKPGSPFIGLVEPMGRWGLRCAGGSMGLGAAMSCGIATAMKLLKKPGRVYTVISDGELQTETMFATARNAAKRRLGNLTFLLDKNGFCAMGKTGDVLDIDPKKLFYDWDVCEIDGHDYAQIESALEHMAEKPSLIIANTVKSKGIPKWEGDNTWHYAKIKDDDLEYALSCLNS